MCHLGNGKVCTCVHWSWPGQGRGRGMGGGADSLTGEDSDTLRAGKIDLEGQWRCL